jgi:hypothetical protein
MKIQLIRSDLNAPPGTVHDGIVRGAGGVLFWRCGTVLDVEPADEEAESVVPNWRHNRDKVLISREMLARGIDPDDRERFKRGELSGYNSDGSEIPGPNTNGGTGDDEAGD